MAAATKIAGKLNDLCFATLNAISNVTAYHSKLRMLDSTDFEEQVRSQNKETQCYAITWVSKEVRKPIQSGTGIVELSILLFFRLEQFESSDCNSMYDLVDTISEALTPDETWQSYGVKMSRIMVNRVDNELQDNIAQWKIALELDTPFC